MITIQDIRNAIVEKAAGSWEAGDTDLFRRALEGGNPLNLSFGLNVDDQAGRLKAASDQLFESMLAAPPPRFDWRSEQGGRVGRVKDQGRCGACVAFATCAAMESAEWIRTGNEMLLSEGDLFHCNGGSCRDGWGLTHGLDVARDGVGLNSDQSWTDDPKCAGIAKAVRVERFRLHNEINARKRAIARGPVVAGMAVYQDFTAYRSGIYRHVAGDHVGYHAVCVVGYDDDEGCWIVRNSWGEKFGEGGYFRIAYGECGIDLDHPFCSVETTAA